MSVATKRGYLWFFFVVAIVIAALVGIILFEPRVSEQFKRWTSRASANNPHEEPEDSHAGHEHEHGGHKDSRSVELSAQALKNIGFQPITVSLTGYEKSISLPGIVVERPGQSQICISAPLGGIITKVYAIQGQAIAPNTPLFEVRLTHEELVASQGEYLKTAEEFDIVKRELARLESIEEGAILGKRIIDQKYELQKVEGRMRAQREALLLHGLSTTQIDDISKSRTLLKTMTIYSPAHEDNDGCTGDHSYHIQSIEVQPGKQVEAGAPLCFIADHCSLYIEGTAFEEDAERLRVAAANSTKVSVDLLVNNQREPAVKDLKLLYLADRIDPETRSFHFYITLPNKVVLDRVEGSHRFIQWQFNPGQRVEVNVPVEHWESRIVVPIDAVVTDGTETLVYQQSGKHFHRVPVHIEYRDQKTAVISNDGSVFPGDVIAGKGAFQIHLALKNQAGGAVDPHAGHNH